MSRNVRSFVVALVLALGMAVAAEALPPRARPVERGLLVQAWSWIGSVLSLTPVWEKEGSSMDPNGEPRPNTWDTPSSDEGSQMDPNGTPR